MSLDERVTLREQDEAALFAGVAEILAPALLAVVSIRVQYRQPGLTNQTVIVTMSRSERGEGPAYERLS